MMRRRARFRLGERHAQRCLSLSADGERRLWPSFRRGGQGTGRPERRQCGVSAGERHAKSRNRHGPAAAQRARQSARRRACPDRRAYAAHRCCRCGERRAGGRGRPAADAGRRLGDGRVQDGRILSRQRRDRPRAARRLPRPDFRRRQDRAAGSEAAERAHGRDPDDLVGRRIHRLGRLHRHHAQC